MPGSDFSINSRIFVKIRIEPQVIYGQGGPDFPRLVINAHITLKPIESEGKDQQGKPITVVQNYTLVQIFGSLFIRPFTGNEIRITDFQSIPLLHFSVDWEMQQTLEIPIDLFRLNRIEEMRRGDAQLKFLLRCLLAKHPLVRKPTEPLQMDQSIQRLELTGAFELSLPIPQSHWVANVLPGLGYGKVKMVEIPIPARVVPDTFTKALAELDQAQNYLNQGDSDKAVGHCRKALETIPNSVSLKFEKDAKPSFPDKVDKFLETLSPSLTDSKKEGLAKMMKALWPLTSIPQHPHPAGYFNRTDAEAIMMMCTAILSYVGKLLVKTEK